MADRRSIFIGSSVHRWNDNRIFYKEAVSLSKHYDVELHAPADFENKSFHGVIIVGLSQWKKEYDRKNIRHELWNRLKNSNADIFIFHDPELIWVGIKTAITTNKKVIYDIHENTVESIKQKKWLNIFSKRISIVVYTVLQWIGTKVFSHFLLAENSYKSIIKNNATTILNYPIVKDWPTSGDKLYDLVYLGDVTEDRGGVSIIEIIRVLKENNNKIKLAIVGKIPHTFQKIISNKIKLYGLENNVDVFGYLNYPDAMKIVSQSKIGLSLLMPIKNYMYSYPTKLFDYMQGGIPFICSNFPLYKELVKECKTGITVEPLSINEACNEILILLNDQMLYNKMCSNGKSALKEKYNWSTQENKLIDLINSL